MMQRSLEEVLGPFQEQNLTTRICSTLFGALPGAPPFVFYNDLAGAVRRVHGDANEGLARRAGELAASEDVRRALAVADALDTADAGLAVVAGLGNLFAMFGSAKRQRTFESDTQQAIDASLKLLALAYMSAKLFPGSPSEKLQSLMALPAGRETLLYSTLVEVALPFTDNVAEAGGAAISKLLKSSSSGGGKRLEGFVGAAGMGEARSMLSTMTGQLEKTLASVSGQVRPVTDRLRAFVPTALGVTDSVTGVVASGLDAMPVWRFLGGRLAAEACAQRATGDA